MSNFHLDLRFEREGSGLPGPPTAHIYVKSFSSDDSGHKYLSPECVSARELEEAVEFLHKELNHILDTGRRLFAAAEKE
jgi:hypothetical protein